ncbi:MAG: ATPase domain-containing protein [Candidatus Woesearchaeota archaeon]
MTVKIKVDYKNKLKNLKEYVVLATVDSERYMATNLALVRHLTKEEGTPGVYVTLNRPYETMKAVFEYSKIDTDMIIFIDAVTKTAGGKVEKTDNCLYIGNPENLSDISMAMDQAVRALPGKDKFVFFDSLNTLLLYNSLKTVARFVHFLASKMRVWGVKGIIISLEKEAHKELIDELNQYCDLKMEF